MDKPKLKEIILSGSAEIKYIYMDSDYGRAEFSLCPIYKYGKLKKIHIYPLQQKNIDCFYTYIVSNYCISWSLTAWTHKGIDEPRTWIYRWCKEHKCLSMRVYVPNYTSKIVFEPLSNLQIRFEK